MSDASTIRLIEMYYERATAPMFLATMFQSPQRNYHSSEAVEVDVVRDTENVAIVITDIATGSHIIENNIYTNKKLIPPIYSEKGVINAFKMMQRRPGTTPYEDPNYLANATAEAFNIYGKGELKIRRAVELMGSQVLQTGKLSLLDAAGVARYELDFKPKTTHFANSGTTWPVAPTSGLETNTASTAYAEVSAMCETIRQDGKKRVTRLIFGAAAFGAFLLDYQVKQRLVPLAYGASSLNPMGTGRFNPQDMPEDATFQGLIRIGNYEVEMWTYLGYYAHPQTGTLTQYVNTNNVIFQCASGRLDLTWGNIPRIVPPDPRALPFMPGRISMPGMGMDIIPNAWISADGVNLEVSAAARPLTIPTAIDTIGCIIAIH